MVGGPSHAKQKKNTEIHYYRSTEQEQRTSNDRLPPKTPYNSQARTPLPSHLMIYT